MDKPILFYEVRVHANRLTAIQVRAILEGAFDAIAELEKEGLVIVHLDGMSVWAVITGSFPTGDAAFDPERNALELSIRLDDPIRLALASATAQMVTDADLAKVRLDNVKDIEVDRPVNLIHGQHPFRAAGVNLVLSDAGARVYLKDRNGTEHAVAVDEVHSNQLFTAHTAELLEGGDYTLRVESRSGDAEGPLQRDKCRIKYLRVGDPEPPAPTGPAVTAINDGTFHRDDGNVVTGANMRFADDSPASHVTITDGEGNEVSAMIGDDSNVESGPEQFGLIISPGEELTPGAAYTFSFEMLDADGEPVTVSHSARWRAE